MKLSELLEARFDLETGRSLSSDAAGQKLSHALSKPEEIAAAIKQHAGDMLKAYQLADGFIYRGMGKRHNPDEASSQYATIRGDRQTVDVSAEQHEVLDAAFKRIGVDATRKNGIFCSAQLETAKNWGSKAFIIFLKDGWSATVFDKRKDTYAFYDLVDAAEDLPQNKKVGAIVDLLKDLGIRKITTVNGLAEIIKDEYYDIIMTGHSYIALEVGTTATSKVLKALGLEDVLT